MFVKNKKLAAMNYPPEIQEFLQAYDDVLLEPKRSRSRLISKPNWFCPKSESKITKRLKLTALVPLLWQYSQ